MNKVVYELRQDGNIYDARGVMIVSNCGYESLPLKETSTSIQDIIKLKEAGFSADEITDMKEKGVI